MDGIISLVIVTVVLFVGLIVLFSWIRIIPNNRIGIVEKRFSGRGSVQLGPDRAERRGRLPAAGPARRHALPRCPSSTRVHMLPLVTIPQGKIGYVFARDGAPAQPDPDAGRRRSPGDNFQDAAGFLQAAASAARSARSCAKVPTPSTWRSSSSSPRSASYSCRSAARTTRSFKRMAEIITSATASARGHQGHRRPGRHRHRPRRPVARAGRDHRPDGRRRPEQRRDIYHNNFQDPERFLRGRRPARPPAPGAGRGHLLHQPPVRHGRDDPQDRSSRSATSAWSSPTPATSAPTSRARTTSTASWCSKGSRGVWSEPLLPGKYAFNTYAGKVDHRADDQLHPQVDPQRESARTSSTRTCRRSR